MYFFEDTQTDGIDNDNDGLIDWEDVNEFGPKTTTLFCFLTLQELLTQFH